MKRQRRIEDFAQGGGGLKMLTPSRGNFNPPPLEYFRTLEISQMILLKPQYVSSLHPKIDILTKIFKCLKIKIVFFGPYYLD